MYGDLLSPTEMYSALNGLFGILQISTPSWWCKLLSV